MAFDFNKLSASPVGVSGEAISDTFDFNSLSETPEGVATQAGVETPGYLSRVASDFGRIAGEVKQAVETGAESFGQQRDITDVSGTLGATKDLARAGLRTVGGVAQGAFTPIFEAPGVKQAVEGAVGFVTKQRPYLAIQNLVPDSLVPKIDKFLLSAEKTVKDNPEVVKDLQNVVDIVALGYGVPAGQATAKEAGLIARDIPGAAQAALSPTEKVVQEKVVELFQKSIKPTPKKTVGQAEQYENSVLNALRTIRQNADDLNIQDVSGEIVTGRTPKTLNELAQSVEQTKKLVFTQYDDLAKKAGEVGAVIDAKAISGELTKFVDNKAIQLTHPELIQYAQGWQARLEKLGSLDSQTAQEVVQTMNNSLQAFYRNPTFDAATRATVDAAIANNMREALDRAIIEATGSAYKPLKRQYGALKAIENDVVRASNRDARRNVKGLIDYTDMFTSGQMAAGILSLNPAMFTKGAIERGIKEYLKILNDPNRAVSNMFDKLGDATRKEFVAQSATLKAAQKAQERLFKATEKGKVVDLKMPSKAVVVPANIKKTPEMKTLETKIADNVKAQKVAIKAGDTKLVAKLKQAYDSLVEKLKSLVRQFAEDMKNEQGMINPGAIVDDLTGKQIVIRPSDNMKAIYKQTDSRKDFIERAKTFPEAKNLTDEQIGSMHDVFTAGMPENRRIVSMEEANGK